jgi:hypothetical protein
MMNPTFHSVRSVLAFRKASWRVPAKILAGLVAPLLATGVALVTAAGPAAAGPVPAAARAASSTHVVVTAEHTADGYVLATGSGLRRLPRRRLPRHLLH